MVTDSNPISLKQSNHVSLEAKIRAKALLFERKYFRDLILEDPVMNDYLSFPGDSSAMIRKVVHEEKKLKIANWTIVVRSIEKIDGEANADTRTIQLNEHLSGKKMDVVLLHEMIHAYEDALPDPLRDWLLLQLVERVSATIHSSFYSNRLNWIA
jgi:hypothetical protein